MHTTTDADRHPKQDFQVERLAFFSDAIFAIAITLLIIDLKVPHITKDSTLASVVDDLIALRYNFIALLVSFFLIAMYWMRHHFLFKHIHSYNRTIVITNLVVLLPIIFFPFTTGFVAESLESVHNKEIPFLALQFFMVNHILAGLSIYFLYWLATVKHKEFCFEMSRVERVKFNFHVLFPAIFFVIVFILTLFKADKNTFLPVLAVLAILRRIVMPFMIKKAKNKPQAVPVPAQSTNV